ncbi:hypothetical protein QUF50_03260 [Thiotrichales bacterium HSG1]|nr:hypothetical protein [Thiotrichales bacterium HSG1]
MRYTLKVNLSLIGLLLFSSVFAEEKMYSCIDEDGSLYRSEQVCPAEYTARAIEIPSNWKNYCIATFEDNYSYQDSISGWKIDIKKGDQLLIGTKKKKNSFLPTTFVYLTDQGAITIPYLGSNDRLFKSSCDSKSTKSVFAIFDDVTLYLDRNLEKQACQLSSGTVIDILAAYSFGGWLSTVSLTLEPLASLCNGHKKVHYKMKQTNLGDAAPLVRLLVPQLKKGSGSN